MADPLLVGLDMGTSSAKAAVFTLDGAQLAAGRRPMRWRTSPGRAETTADDLFEAAHGALDDALARVEHPVAGIGVTGMGEAGVLVGGSGAVAAPVISWHDERDSVEVEELGTQIGAEALATTAGLPLRRQWTLTKYRWLRRHLGTLPPGARWLSVAEWVVHRLGGEQASDLSLASRTGWLDITEGGWWPEALAFSGITAEQLPPLVQSGTPLGTVGEALPRGRGAVLTTAGHDHQAAALGAGAAGPGCVLDSSGTAEALVRTVEAGLPAADVRRLASAGTTVGRHVIGDRLCLLAATEGGLALARLQRLLGVDRAGLPELDRQALFTSQRHDVRVEGIGGPSLTVSGIGDEVTPGVLWAAGTATVTAAAADLLRDMNAVVGAHERLVVTGGWTHSRALMAAKRTHFGSVEHFAQSEPGARGAALLAGSAAGVLQARVGTPQWRSRERYLAEPP